MNGKALKMIINEIEKNYKGVEIDMMSRVEQGKNYVMYQVRIGFFDPVIYDSIYYKLNAKYYNGVVTMGDPVKVQ
jgi:hypothetical protein